MVWFSVVRVTSTMPLPSLRRTKKWDVLKSSPSGLVTLQEGVEESIQGLDVDDLLRVDAQGSNFFFQHQ